LADDKDASVGEVKRRFPVRRLLSNSDKNVPHIKRGNAMTTLSKKTHQAIKIALYPDDFYLTTLSIKAIAFVWFLSTHVRENCGEENRLVADLLKRMS
jgi:hypothetical protein